MLKRNRKPRQPMFETLESRIIFSASPIPIIAPAVVQQLAVVQPLAISSFSVGGRVQATDNLNVRNSYSTTAAITTTELAGSQGTVTAGPQSGSGYTWYSINWDNGGSGWSVADYLSAAPANYADLVPQGISLGSSSGLAGSSLPISFSVANFGSGTSLATTANIRLSNSFTTPSTSDPLLGTVSINALSSGAQQSFSPTFAIPTGTSAGQKYVWVIVDPGNSAGQGANINNDRVMAGFSVTTPVQNSDLVTQNLAVGTGSGLAGSTVNVTFVIKNQGAGTAAASVARIRLNNNLASVSASDPLLVEINVPSIAAGGSFVVNQAVTVPAGTSAGQKYVWVTLDATSAANQGSNEGNDRSNIGFVVVTAPVQSSDLVTQNLVVNPTSVSAGSQVTLSFSIKNQGSGDAGASLARIRLNTSTSSVTSSDPILADINVPAIAAGSSYLVNQVVTVPSGAAVGTDYVWVTIDVNSTANQGGNESNDKSSAAIVVSGGTTSTGWGQVVATFNGVEIHSNINDPNPTSSPSPHNFSAGTDTGEMWQCVEFVNRYYWQHYGMDLRSLKSMNANDFYGSSPTLHLSHFKNGGITPPQVGDILCFSGNGNGHVAIVSSVSGNSVTVAQQNVGKTAPVANSTFTMTVTNGVYRVNPSAIGTGYTCQGWLRTAGLQPGVYQAETSAKGGGTVASHSYAGYNGSGYLDFGGIGSTATFSVDQPTAGTAQLTLRYANGGKTAAPLMLTVNGVAVGTVNVVPTGGWSKWSTVTVSVSLNSGFNIVLLTTTTAGGPNLDSLSVNV